MSHSVIVSAARTAIGSYGGSLKNFSAPQLGSAAIHAAVTRSGLKADLIEQVIMGCVLAAGTGQAPTRQAALGANLPQHTGALTINKVCSSGLKAVMLADLMIRAGDAETCLAGGMESMSNAPYLLPKARFGYRLGDGKLIDSMVQDGLWDPFHNTHMGNIAEQCANTYKLSRTAQDEFAIQSYQRAQSAIATGAFKEECFPIELKSRKAEGNFFAADEEPAAVKFDKIAKIPPVFEKTGTITAANASSLSDGSAALVIMSAARAEKLGLKPLAKIVASAENSQAPELYTTAPIKAAQNALQKANLTTADIDLFEINEAFACVTLAAIQELELDNTKVNINGGAVSLGHPIGASGARILTTLLYALKNHDKKRGLASICNGGGEATAMIIELL